MFLSAKKNDNKTCYEQSVITFLDHDEIPFDHKHFQISKR